jgi:hypothetical protein
MKAGDETRTRDIQLGKLVLYQLSYARNAFSIELLLSNATLCGRAACAQENGLPGLIIALPLGENF